MANPENDTEVPKVDRQDAGPLLRLIAVTVVSLESDETRQSRVSRSNGAGTTGDLGIAAAGQKHAGALAPQGHGAQACGGGRDGSLQLRRASILMGASIASSRWGI